MNMKITKKSFGSILAIFLLCSLSVCSDNSKTPTDFDDYTVFYDYKEIPGITKEEIASIEQLKTKYDKFVYGMNYNTECFYSVNRELKGYSALFCEWLSTLFGIRFEPAIYDWDSLLNGLANYKIDFSGEITATPERREFLFMTAPIAERTIKMMSILGSEELSLLSHKRKLRYAFLQDSTSYSLIKPFLGYEFETVYVNEYERTYTLLKNGQIDAFFDDGTAEAAFDAFGDIIAEDFSPLIYTPVSLSTQNPELKVIISVINKVLQNKSNQHLAKLYQEGNNEYLKNKMFHRLTAEEKIYLEEHVKSGAPILFGIEFDNYPISFYNEQEEEWQGIAIDILNEVNDLTGLTFKRVNNEMMPWSLLLEMLKNNEISMVGELIRSQDRKEQFLWTTKPYQTDHYALLSSVDYPDIAINDIFHTRIGLIIDSAYADVFHQWFPAHHDTIEYITVFDALQALEAGEIDLLMGTRNLILSMTNYLEMPGYKVNIVFGRAVESSFGFNKNEKILCSIFSKAQNLINTATISDRWTRKVFDYRGAMARAQLPYLAGLSMLFLCVIVLMVVLFIRKRESERVLEVTVFERTRDLQIQTLAAEKASKDAQIASQFKSEFLARMSHELRTPLNAIIGMAAIAKTASSHDKVNASITEVETASKHLMGVLNDVLDMSKIESGKFILAMEEYMFRTAMEEVISIIQQRCDDKNLRFITNIDSVENFGVYGDKLRLKQVLINLLGNAVKFTARDGQIKFLIKILKENNQEFITGFTVTDTGIGISEEQKGKLFSAFEQADATIAIRFGGTGLGLTISQNLVGMMGGEIMVESELNKGSTFSFSIPLTKMTEELKEISVISGIPMLKGKRILVVEDIEINRVILSELLSETEVEIDEASDGVEAVKKFSSSVDGTYDLIIMDIQMPNMDGYEATRSIRVLERHDAKVVPIIALTANAYQEDINRALDAGMNSHLSKPINIEAVMHMLAEYLLQS